MQLFKSLFCLVVLSIVSVGFAEQTFGQLIYQEVGNQGGNDSYWESGSVSGAFQGPNWFFRFGDAAPPLAPFGGQNFAGGGIAGGVGFGGGGFSGNLNFNFAQGSSRSMTSSTAGVTTMDGYPGSIQSQTMRPFVTGVTPIVSSNHVSPETVQNQRALAMLRQSQVATKNKKLQSYLQRAETAYENEKYTMARANLKSALRLVSNLPGHQNLRMQLQAQMKVLGNQIKETKRAERIAKLEKRKALKTTDTASQPVSPTP